MTSNTQGSQVNKYAIAMYAAIALIAAALLRGITVYTDPFHSGEFFASAVSFFKTDSQSLPLTIHGALDFLPAVIAKNIWGINNYFLPTLAIYKAFIFIGGVIFIFMTGTAIEKSKLSPWLIIAIGLSTPFLLTYRDTFFLGSVYIFIRLSETDQEKKINYALHIIFGILTASSMLWSYERGLACTLSLGFASLLLAIKKKSFLVAIASFLITLFIAGIIHPAFSLSFYFENIQFLMATSSQWSTGSKPSAIAITLFAVMINGFSLLCYWRSVLESTNKKTMLYQAIGLTALTLITLKTSTNRADVSHLYPALIMPIILMSKSIPLSQPYPKFLFLAIFSLPLAGIALSFKAASYMPFLCILIISFLLIQSTHYKPAFFNQKTMRFFIIAGVLAELLNITTGVTQGGYNWLRKLQHPPSNENSSEASMQWVSREIKKSNSTCLLDLSNNGIINGITGLPSCSRITYPVYATRQYEDELIEAVVKNDPKTIVYSATVESYSIDNKPMSKRFPKLDAYLLTEYPYQKCNFGYCLRSK